MANQNGSGRHVATSDENRPSWRPQDQQDDDRSNDGRGMRHWDESRDRGTDSFGAGQSGYMAGRRDDRGTGMMGRNQDYGRSDERDRGVHSDDRFYGRGGASYDEPRGYGYDDGDRNPRFVQHPGYRGGSAYGRSDTGYDRNGQGNFGQGNFGQGNYGQGNGQGNFGQGNDRGDRNVGTYGPQQGFSGQHGGYGQMDQGNYGQSGRQDSFGQGNFGQRGTQNQGMRAGGHRGKGPQNFTRSDDRIKEHVSEMLTDHDDIDASNIDVQVRNGEVTLTGTVDDRHQRRMIEDTVEGISGVKEVHMSIKLRGDRGSAMSRGSSTTPSLENNGSSSNDSRKARA